MSVRFLEDFKIGQTFGSGRLKIDAADIKRFASEFDPQPFHLDEQAASGSIFRGLAASGWRRILCGLSEPTVTEAYESVQMICNALTDRFVRRKWALCPVKRHEC